jgi:hypothetical protein
MISDSKQNDGSVPNPVIFRFMVNFTRSLIKVIVATCNPTIFDFVIQR